MSAGLMRQAGKPSQSKRRLALLIDCDNAESSSIEDVLAEASAHGSVTIKHGYGDWDTSSLKSWSKQCDKWAIEQVQQPRRAGKNSTDIAMAIGAMDILHSKAVEGIALYTGDADFISLASRIRKGGLFALGFSSYEKTTKELVAAFDRFIYTEYLGKDYLKMRVDDREAELLPLLKELRALLRQTYDTLLAHETAEGVLLSAYGIALHSLKPDFDPRAYGFGSLSDLIDGLAPQFVVTRQEGRTRIARKPSGRRAKS